MDIIVAVASKHGSTRSIAEAIADELQAAGSSVHMRNIDEDPRIERYDAAVIGSAIYMGNWLPQARRFVDRNQRNFVGMPVWLFSSGPLGQADPQPKGDPAQLDALMETTGARGHRIFVGKLDKRNLSRGERLIARAVRAPEGDFRDWGVIRGWAREIAAELRSEPGGPSANHDGVEL